MARVKGERQERGRRLRDKLLCIKAARMYSTAQRIQPILYNNLNGVKSLKTVNHYAVHRKLV